MGVNGVVRGAYSSPRCLFRCLFRTCARRPSRRRRISSPRRQSARRTVEPPAVGCGWWCASQSEWRMCGGVHGGVNDGVNGGVCGGVNGVVNRGVSGGVNGGVKGGVNGGVGGCMSAPPPHNPLVCTHTCTLCVLPRLQELDPILSTCITAAGLSRPSARGGGICVCMGVCMPVRMVVRMVR